MNSFPFISVFYFLVQPLAAQPEAADAVRAALDQWRGKSSYLEETMTVHRPDWERTTSMISITRGQKDGIVRFTAPAKDAGNATLKLDRDMWVFTPRLNQLIKLPASLMAQSWMGSDFSYDDLAKSDQVLTDFSLTLQATEEVDGHQVLVIEAIPLPDAPVVWGKEILRIRDDHILVEWGFFDQDGKLVKHMVSSRIENLDGRAYAMEIRMVNAEETDHWTLIVTEKGRFDVEPPNYLFTQSNLRNPRNWKPK